MKLHRTAFLALPILSSLSAFDSQGFAQEALCTDKPLPIRWEIEPLTLDANEGCAIADVNGDSKPDIIAGRHWYPSPSFVSRPLRNIDDWNGYIQSNGDFPFDVNRDGKMDVIAGSFVPTEIAWYE
ncbi:MAG: hypothetical protein ACKO9Q_02470, partial [Pirellula sp.]